MNDETLISERCKDIAVALLIGAAALFGILGVVSTARSGPDDDAAAALALAQAQAALKIEPAPPIGNTYAGVMAECVAKNRIGVIYVGHYMGAPLTNLGLTRIAQSVEVDELPGFTAPCVVICEPYDGRMVWKATLSCRASPAELKAAIDGKAKAVSQPAPPFLDPRSIPRKVVAPPDGQGAKTAGPQFNASHRCPNCGTLQTLISGTGPERGTHTHTCPKCGTSWYH
jgi:hypothetical protein